MKKIKYMSQVELVAYFQDALRITGASGLMGLLVIFFFDQVKSLLGFENISFLKQLLTPPAFPAKLYETT